MSALAEALVAAQRRAIGALEKAYVAGTINTEELSRRLSLIGATDTVEGTYLIEALDVIRETGVTLPNEVTANGKVQESPGATDAQLALIADLVQRNKLEAPDLPLTKTDASAIITSMKDGSYDAAKWKVPF